MNFRVVATQPSKMVAKIRSRARAARSCYLVAGTNAVFLPAIDSRLYACPIHDGQADLSHMVAIETDSDLLVYGLEPKVVEQLTPQSMDTRALTERFAEVLFNRSARGLSGARRGLLFACWRHLIEIERILLDDGPGAYMAANGFAVWPIDGYGLNALHFAAVKADAVQVPSDQVRHWTQMRELDEEQLHRLESSLRQMISRPEIRSFEYRIPPRPSNSQH